MPAHQLRRDVLSLPQCGDSLTDLATLRMSAGYVDHHPGPPLSGQPGSVNGGCGTKGAARVAKLDGDGDLMQGHVGRAELGVVVVAPLTQPSRDLGGSAQMGVSGVRV